MRDLLDVWDGAEDHYHILFPMRWASSLFADLNGGQPERAPAQFEVAAQLLRDTDTPFEEASTRLRAGQVLAALGEREAALGHLHAAHRTARSLHAVPLARKAARALEGLTQTTGDRASRPGLGLTRRQLEVLGLVARGHTDKATAQELRLSPRTVEMHVGGILASLDSRTRAEAVGKAARLGLLAPADRDG